MKLILISVFLTWLVTLSIYYLMRQTETFLSKERDKTNKRSVLRFHTNNMTKLEIVKQQDEASLLPLTSDSANIIGGVFVNTEGGLGNKIFRYACAYTLAKRLNISLYLPPTGKEDKLIALESFSIRDASIEQLPKIVHYNETNFQPFKTIYDEDILWYWDRLQRNVTLKYNSFCQSEEYFREFKKEIKANLRQDLNSQDEENETMRKWLKEIENSERSSVAVHIRRGDYMKIATNIEFYVKAINMIQRMISADNITFFIFSDSIQLVKNEFENATGNVPWEKMHFVSDPKAMTNIQEFKLMRNCSNIITSNSSFSWWAAYLMKNKDKIVISPAFREDVVKTFVQVTNIKNFNLFLYNSLYYPKEWIVLSSY